MEGDFLMCLGHFLEVWGSSLHQGSQGDWKIREVSVDNRGGVGGRGESLLFLLRKNCAIEHWFCSGMFRFYSHTLIAIKPPLLLTSLKEK